MFLYLFSSPRLHQLSGDLQEDAGWIKKIVTPAETTIVTVKSDKKVKNCTGGKLRRKKLFRDKKIK